MHTSAYNGKETQKESRQKKRHPSPPLPNGAPSVPHSVPSSGDDDREGESTEANIEAWEVAPNQRDAMRIKAMLKRNLTWQLL